MEAPKRNTFKKQPTKTKKQNQQQHFYQHRQQMQLLNKKISRAVAAPCPDPIRPISIVLPGRAGR
jgi:hypothetical protein